MSELKSERAVDFCAAQICWKKFFSCITRNDCLTALCLYVCVWQKRLKSLRVCRRSSTVPASTCVIARANVWMRMHEDVCVCVGLRVHVGESIWYHYSGWITYAYAKILISFWWMCARFYGFIRKRYLLFNGAANRWHQRASNAFAISRFWLQMCLTISLSFSVCCVSV